MRPVLPGENARTFVSQRSQRLPMEIIFNKISVLVTAAFALTLVPGFRRSDRSLLSARDRWTALLVFLLLGLVEETVVRQTGWFNHRIVVVCAASLLAGPGVGVIVGLISDLVGRYLRRAAAGYDRA
jgi:LytS/YehU family sensor histidine kinase